MAPAGARDVRVGARRGAALAGAIPRGYGARLIPIGCAHHAAAKWVVIRMGAEPGRGDAVGQSKGGGHAQRHLSRPTVPPECQRVTPGPADTRAEGEVVVAE